MFFLAFHVPLRFSSALPFDAPNTVAPVASSSSVAPPLASYEFDVGMGGRALTPLKALESASQWSRVSSKQCTNAISFAFPSLPADLLSRDRVDESCAAKMSPTEAERDHDGDGDGDGGRSR